jgi:hypothetical protein
VTAPFVLSPRIKLSNDACASDAPSHYLLFMRFRVIFLYDSHL